MEGRNGCVFCVHEDGATCLKFNKRITGNRDNAYSKFYNECMVDKGLNGAVYLNQDNCSGFELLEGMKDNWERQFG